MYVRSEYNEKNNEEIDVGCLLIFDETNQSVIDSFTLNNGRNYICGTTKSVFEPSIEKNFNETENSNGSYHAIIYFEEGEFFIEDNESEIGTFRKSLNFRIKPFCKYEVIPGEIIYFGNLKTKLIKYDDTSEAIETPKWKHKRKNSSNIKQKNELKKMFYGRISTRSDDSNESLNDIKPKEVKKTRSKEDDSIINENKENNALLNEPKKRSPNKSANNRIEDKKKISLLWTGCTPTNKDLELIKRANITYIENEDLEFMSDKVTHVISSSIKRTLKFLWAVSKGLPIISPNTLRQILSSNKSKNIDFQEFNKICMKELLLDTQGEKKFDFSLKNSIIKAQNNSIFTGYKFVISPNIKIPSINEINWLITSGNAKVIDSDEISNISDKSKLIIIGTNLDTKLFK